MEGFKFYKMSGHGNDFIIVDNRNTWVNEDEMAPMTKALCRRGLSIGADGMIFIQNGSEDMDFSWRFYNADGSEAEMCGNGARCAALFAYMLNIAPEKMSFKTLAGVIRAEVFEESVRIETTTPHGLELDYELEIDGERLALSSLDTGVPHAVLFIEDAETAPVFDQGRTIRYHDHFQPNGTNVNFTQVLDSDTIVNRTYERGVEGETLACGTGCVAAALLAAEKDLVQSPVRVLTRGGEDLIIRFKKSGNAFQDVSMEGPVRIVYTGHLGPDALT
ncbi:MAG: diaminopimelate epimerase [Deltaproteobacteria bacterium]|nr:diaminopimelate epimerase [Deltaproteobacteria bacterium]